MEATMEPTPPPLGLPPGSVRAIALLLMAVTLCASVFLQIEPPEWMLTIFGAQIGEYVTRRGNGKGHEQ